MTTMTATTTWLAAFATLATLALYEAAVALPRRQKLERLA